MPIGVVVVRESYLPVAPAGQFVFPHKGGPIGIATVINHRSTVVGPHLMAYPVGRLALMVTRVASGVGTFLTYADDGVAAVVVEPNTADAAVKTRPFMVEHDEFGIGGVELHVGNPAQGHLLLIGECSRGSVVDTEVTAQPLFLHAPVDVVDRPPVQPIPFLVGVVVQGPAVGHRDAEQPSVTAHMGEGRHPAVGHMVEHSDDSVQSHLADLVVLDIVDNITRTVKAYAGLAQSLAGLAVEIHITLQRAMVVVGQSFLLARGQIPDIDVGVAVAVADDIQPLVVAAE